MKLTKYEHACFTVEKDGKLLIIDPGAFTQDLGAPENVAGIVVTHSHSDHFDPAALGALIAHNPDAVIIAHKSITAQLGETLPNRAVSSSDELDIGPFNVKFDGGEHAVIHPSMPVIPNLGVLIDESIYYPGDSFNKPPGHIDVLALPAAAPWCKISEITDYLLAVKPRLAFPTHDAILSDTGKTVTDMMISSFADKEGITYQRLREPTDI